MLGDAADVRGVVTLARAIEARELRLRTLLNNAGAAPRRAGRDHPIEQVGVLQANLRMVLQGDARCRLHFSLQSAIGHGADANRSRSLGSAEIDRA